MTTYSVPVPVTTTSLPVIGQPMSQQFIAQQQQPTTFQPMTIQQPVQQIVTQQPIAQSPVFIPPRPSSPRITNVQPVSTVVNGPPITTSQPSTVQVTTTPSMNGGGQTVSVVTTPQPTAAVAVPVPVTTVLTQQPVIQQPVAVAQPLQGQIQPQSNLMTIAPYGDRGTSFKVTGIATKNYTTTLKSMGGGFYKNVGDGVPGWIFDNSQYNNVVNFVAQANSGNVVSNSNRYVKRNVVATQPTQVTTTSIALPTVSTSTDSAVSPSVTMQNVSWTVPKPDVRMRVRVLVDNMAADYIITQIQPNPTTGNVETAYISPSNNPGLSSKLVIVNGKWQVWGYMQDHSVNFY